MKAYQFASLALLTAGLLLAPAQAARRKSDPGPHPLKILKIVQDSNSRQSMGGSSGRYHLWLQNTTDVDVDKVQVEMEIYSKSGRLEDTVRKELGNVAAGAKAFVELKYNIIGTEIEFKPRFWVQYNGGKETLTQFEIDGASWNY